MENPKKHQTKKTTQFGTINVNGTKAKVKRMTLADDMAAKNMYACAVQEVRRKGNGVQIIKTTDEKKKLSDVLFRQQG